MNRKLQHEKITRFTTHTIILTSVFCLLTSFSFAQSKKDIVAKAGNITISKEEFRKRYEFTPHVRTEMSYDSTGYKKEFLQTLIAEKLLALAATKDGIDKSQNINMAMNYLHSIFLRDALYKKEVVDKIIIPDPEVVTGMIRIMKTIRTKFIFSQDKDEIQKLYSDITKGASFDSILTTRPEDKEQKEAAEITFGAMNEIMENAIYQLSVGEVTRPVELKEGWYISKVYSITSKIGNDKDDKHKVELVIKSRVEDKIYQEFYKKFFKGIVVNADREVFEKLYSKMITYMIKNKKSFQINRDKKYKLLEVDIRQLRNEVNKEDLNKIFIQFQKNPVSLRQFFDYMSFQEFEFPKVDSLLIRSKLNSYVSTYIQNELLAREASKRGYEQLPEVANELKTWKEYYLSREMMKKVFNSVNISDDEAYKFFTKSERSIQQTAEVNVAEILTNDLPTVELILKELDKGADFKTLAKIYTLRDSLRSRGGEFGFFPVTEKGDIGKTASQMKVGDVFGPIKTDEGYSVIKLLDKKEGKKEKVGSFDEAKDDIKNILRTRKMNKDLDDITAKLAVENGIEINESALKSVKVTSVDMIVLRRFGFGGQLLAAPYAPNFSSWFKKYEQLKRMQLP